MKKIIVILGVLISFSSFECYSQCAVPVFGQGTSQTISCGDTTYISVQNWCSGCSYAWSDGQAGINIAVVPLVTTSYDVTVTCVDNSTAISSLHTVNVNSVTIPIIQQGSSVSICGEDTTQLTVSNWCGGCNYAWSNGDAGINIAVSQTGSYDVTVTEVNGCMATSSVTSVIDTCITGIVDVGFIDDLNIYPNPSEGRFFVEVSEIQDLDLRVFNVLGKIVYEEMAFDKKFDIDLSCIEEGIYFVEVGNVRKKVLVVR